MTIKHGSSCKRYWKCCTFLFVFPWREKWEPCWPNGLGASSVLVGQLLGWILSQGHFLTFMLKKPQGLFVQPRACFGGRWVGTHTWTYDWPVSHPIQSKTTSSLSFALTCVGINAMTKQMNTIFRAKQRNCGSPVACCLFLEYAPYPIMLLVMITCQG